MQTTVYPKAVSCGTEINIVHELYRHYSVDAYINFQGNVMKRLNSSISRILSAAAMFAAIGIGTAYADTDSVKQKVERTANKTGEAVEHGAEVTKTAVVHGAEKTKEALTTAAEKTDRALHTAADKTAQALHKAGDKIEEKLGSDSK